MFDMHSLTKYEISTFYYFFVVPNIFLQSRCKTRFHKDIRNIFYKDIPNIFLQSRPQLDFRIEEIGVGK
jgi:hypothetical protein